MPETIFKAGLGGGDPVSQLVDSDLGTLVDFIEFGGGFFRVGKLPPRGLEFCVHRAQRGGELVATPERFEQGGLLIAGAASGASLSHRRRAPDLVRG